MTKTEAAGLEALADKIFSEALSEDVSLSMALTGKLRVKYESGVCTFDPEDGEVNYVRYTGMKSDLDIVCDQIKAICQDKRNKYILNRLKWSYEHIRDLVDDVG